MAWWNRSKTASADEAVAVENVEYPLTAAGVTGPDRPRGSKRRWRRIYLFDGRLAYAPANYATDVSPLEERPQVARRLVRDASSARE